jgi:hypothetical protein
LLRSQADWRNFESISPYNKEAEALVNPGQKTSRISEKDQKSPKSTIPQPSWLIQATLKLH